MILCEQEKSGGYNAPIFDTDSILDGLTFETLIMEIRCNTPKDKITFETFKKQLKEDLEIRMQDAFAMLELCKDTIVKAAKI